MNDTTRAYSIESNNIYIWDLNKVKSFNKVLFGTLGTTFLNLVAKFGGRYRFVQWIDQKWIIMSRRIIGIKFVQEIRILQKGHMRLAEHFAEQSTIPFFRVTQKDWGRRRTDRICQDNVIWLKKTENYGFDPKN